MYFRYFGMDRIVYDWNVMVVQMYIHTSEILGKNTRFGFIRELLLYDLIK